MSCFNFVLWCVLDKLHYHVQLCTGIIQYQISNRNYFRDETDPFFAAVRQSVVSLPVFKTGNHLFTFGMYPLRCLNNGLSIQTKPNVGNRFGRHSLIPIRTPHLEVPVRISTVWQPTSCIMSHVPYNMSWPPNSKCLPDHYSWLCFHPFRCYTDLTSIAETV
jgi:hypothetical protein